MAHYNLESFPFPVRELHAISLSRMDTWVVTRHPGALEWLARRFDIERAHVVAHLDTSRIQPGDRVVGTLPIQAIAEVWMRGGTYHHLTIPLTPEYRGRELSADDLDRLGASLHCFYAQSRPALDAPENRKLSIRPVGEKPPYA